MKRLFNDKEDWTPEASQLDVEVGLALEPIINKWINDDYSMREVHYIVMQSAYAAGLMGILDRK